jgi:hypothetical protein
MNIRLEKKMFTTQMAQSNLNLTKGRHYAKKKPKQGHPVKSPEQVAVEAQAEVEWVVRLQRDQAENAYVWVVVVKYLTS